MPIFENSTEFGHLVVDKSIKDELFVISLCLYSRPIRARWKKLLEEVLKLKNNSKKLIKTINR